MSSTRQSAVVVGVSGSRASGAALQWAAAEARRRSAPLRIVRSWDRQFHADYAPAASWLTPTSSAVPPPRNWPRRYGPRSAPWSRTKWRPN